MRIVSTSRSMDTLDTRGYSYLRDRTVLPVLFDRCCGAHEAHTSLTVDVARFSGSVPAMEGGFSVREPQGRMGKQGRGGREAIEKQRLAQRVEGFERYEDPGKLTEVSLSPVSRSRPRPRPLTDCAPLAIVRAIGGRPRSRGGALRQGLRGGGAAQP